MYYEHEQSEPDHGTERELERMLEHEPERAAFLYRRHVFRQRQLQHARERRQEQHHAWYHRAWLWQLRLFPSRYAPDPATIVGDEAVVVGEAQSNENQPRLELKTKVFKSIAGMSSGISERNGNETGDDDDEEKGQQSSI